MFQCFSVCFVLIDFSLRLVVVIPWGDKKAVAIRKHLDRNRKDKDSKFRLILVESRIHRLARYYKRVKSLPATWKYVSATASALVA